MPTLAYQYGAFEPTENLPVVREQMRLAHRYRNALVDIELKRRADAEAVLRTHHPELRELAERACLLAVLSERAYRLFKRANARARRKVSTKEDRASAAVLRKAKSAAWKAFGEARKAAWSDPAMKAAQQAVNDAANVAQKKARAECGCYWGTYLIVEEAMEDARKGTPPRFLRWKGEGTVAVQLQGGMSVGELTSGTDTRLRLEGHGRDRLLWLRIGSGGRAGREAVWTKIPFTLHRPLPDGARIKWAKLHLRRRATHEKWFVNFSLDVPADSRPNDRADFGSVGVDLGWRWTKDGLRVAYWFGSDGAEGELTIPPRDVGRWLWSREWQAKADESFNAARDALSAWLKGRTHLPDWMTERTETLGQWKSAARLAGLVLHWRNSRFAGDEAIFAELENWRSAHRKLFEATRCSEAQAIRWRTDSYRDFAAMLRRRYARCAIENIDWSQMQRLPAPEEATAADAAIRHYRRIASPGELAQTIRTFGPATEKMPAKDTTRRCADCGEYTGEPKPENLYHTCAHCGRVEDQDRNAARRLLASLDDASAMVAQGA